MQSDASTVSAAPQSFIRAAVCGEPHSVAWCRGRGVGPFGPQTSPQSFVSCRILCLRGGPTRTLSVAWGECFERKAHKLEADAGDDAEAKSRLQSRLPRVRFGRTALLQWNATRLRDTSLGGAIKQGLASKGLEASHRMVSCCN